MKVLLIAGGVLFLLLSVVLFIAAVVTFFIARKKGRPAAQPVAQPQPQPRPPQPQPQPQPRPQPAVAPPPPPPPAPEADGTIVIDTRRQQWGALRATSGALAGRIFPIDPNGFYIGRDATMSQVVIDSPSVSKRHLWIGVRDGAVVAIDQRSTNGTFLNGPEAAIAEAKLKPGDTLIISQDVARFIYEL